MQNDTGEHNFEEEPYSGPTVAEAAEIRLREINRKIEELQDEKKFVQARLEKYRGLRMLESERIATESERFQETPFPVEDEDDSL